jgi:small basic protein
VIFIPILCLALGVIVGLLLNAPVEGVAGLYLAVACLASLDTIFGGVRSSLENKFHADVFVTGFVSNVLIAFGLSWLGDRIGVNVFLVCAFIFGTRIFNNLSLIRRFWLTQWSEARAKRKQELTQAQSAQTTATNPQS